MNRIDWTTQLKLTCFLDVNHVELSNISTICQILDLVLFFVLWKGTMNLFWVWGGVSILVPQTPIGLRQEFLTT